MLLLTEETNLFVLHCFMVNTLPSLAAASSAISSLSTFSYANWFRILPRLFCSVLNIVTSPCRWLIFFTGTNVEYKLADQHKFAPALRGINLAHDGAFCK